MKLLNKILINLLALSLLSACTSAPTTKLLDENKYLEDVLNTLSLCDTATQKNNAIWNSAQPTSDTWKYEAILSNDEIGLYCTVLDKDEPVPARYADIHNYYKQASAEYKDVVYWIDKAVQVGSAIDEYSLTQAAAALNRATKFMNLATATGKTIH